MSAMTELTPTDGGRAAVIEAGLKLPPDVRHGVALELLDSIHEPPEDPAEVKKAWQGELERRMREIDTGAVRCYSREETMAYLHMVIAEAEGK